MSDEKIALGSCCACGKEDETVVNVMLLSFENPFAGESTPGWGCVQCGLKTIGAIAVVCQDCMVTELDIKFYVIGDLNDNKRRPISELVTPFDHDLSMHSESQVSFDYDGRESSLPDTLSYQEILALGLDEDD